MALDFDSVGGERIGAVDRTPLEELLDLVATPRPAWQRDALCREPAYRDINFFPTKFGANTLELIHAARAVCGRCLVAEECADYAVERGIFHGVWGGTIPGQRRAMRRAAKESGAA